MQFKIVYKGPVNMGFDEKVREVMEQVGAKWYAQGTDLTRNERDICFDIDETEIEM